MAANDSQRQHRMPAPPWAARAGVRLDPGRGGVGHEAEAGLGSGRIVASEIEAPNMLVNLV